MAVPWFLAILFGVAFLTLSWNVAPYKTPAGVVYEMPAECDGDLSEATKDTRVFYQPEIIIASWSNFLKIAPPGWRLYGLTISLPGLPPFIIIDESLSREEHAKTLHHERCHIVAGAWHG